MSHYVVMGMEGISRYRRSCTRWVADLEAQSLTAEQQEQLAKQFLRDPGGADPDKVGPVADLLALGLVNSGWRNTCVENWHAASRMDDGEMMRINSHTTWNVRRRVRRWIAEIDLVPDSPLTALDHISDEAIYQFAAPIYGWLVDRRRKLPAGMTLGILAGDEIAKYAADADTALSAFAWQAGDRGARFGFLRAAAHGALACRQWWGHPNWPTTVDRFLHALDDPHDHHWGAHGEFRDRLGPEPASVINRSLLRKSLLSGPWRLDPGTARWLVTAGIGYLYD